MYTYWNYKENTSIFGAKLKMLREMNNLTQAKLAKELCISRSCVSNYESGVRNPDFDMIKRISEYFNVFVDYLLSTSDYIDMPIEKDKADEFSEISRRLKACGDTIDISGISMRKKIAIIEFSRYIINSDDDIFINPREKIVNK